MDVKFVGLEKQKIFKSPDIIYIMGAKIGHIVTEETRKKIGLANSIALKGNTYPNKGKFKKGHKTWNKGLKTGPQSLETRTKRSNSLKGHPCYKNPKRNKKISISKLGDKNPQKNPIAREKNRQAHLGQKSSLWIDGRSFEPYNSDLNNSLKLKIRERDNYTCQICNKKGRVIHHIDYDKKNSNEYNLITLCESCHGKTSTGDRKKWERKLKKMLK